jgi:hypothetical protein
MKSKDKINLQDFSLTLNSNGLLTWSSNSGDTEIHGLPQIPSNLSAYSCNGLDSSGQIITLKEIEWTSDNWLYKSTINQTGNVLLEVRYNNVSCLLGETNYITINGVKHIIPRYIKLDLEYIKNAIKNPQHFKFTVLKIEDMLRHSTIDPQNDQLSLRLSDRSIVLTECAVKNISVFDVEADFLIYYMEHEGREYKISSSSNFIGITDVKKGQTISFLLENGKLWISAVNKHLPVYSHNTIKITDIMTNFTNTINTIKRNNTFSVVLNAILGR